ncbi:MAG TPA: hypothetical protein VK689_12100 [Armatimonadota bacterium]|nr:hypothetical protein [Armatimonadota bacterium]
MDSSSPRGRRREFTDAQLRADVQDDLKAAQIAEKYGVTTQAVYRRLHRLQLSTTAAAVAPQESERYVSRTLDAMAELLDSLSYVRLLRDALDEWLRDANHPDQYDVGPRATEIHVQYLVKVPTDSSYRLEKRKATLSRLLSAVGEIDDEEVHYETLGAESKYADPRELILKTCQEARATVGAAADLARFLGEARRMEEFREEMLAAIGEASPEVQRAITERLRSRLVLHAAVRGPDALPG